MTGAPGAAVAQPASCVLMAIASSAPRQTRVSQSHDEKAKAVTQGRVVSCSQHLLPYTGTESRRAPKRTICLIDRVGGTNPGRHPESICCLLSTRPKCRRNLVITRRPSGNQGDR